MSYIGQGWQNSVTPEELQLIITTERESTGLEAEERELLNNVFEFGEVTAVEVMIPRTRMSAVSFQSTFAELLDEVAATGHSRYPVIGDSLDDVRGVIDFKDLAVPWSQGRLQSFTLIQAWVKPVRFVSEATLLSDVLSLMQRSHLKMIMLVDEFGGTSGLVTLQDLIDEILGKEMEESGQEAFKLQKLDEHTFLVHAQMNLEDVNELSQLNLPLATDYQTLGGFILYQFQKIPLQGETLHYENLDLTVVSAEGPQLYQIRIHQRELPS